MARGTDKLKNFESNYAKLEELVKALEAPDLTLKESLDLFEKAVKVSRECEGALEYARQRAEALAEAQAVQKDGEGEADSGSVTEEGTLNL
jgi:exodeoxyribonuclease VII small subunit